MRILAASIALGSLLLIGALPAAGQAAPTHGTGGSIRLAAARDTTADRDTYTQRARNEMKEWQLKLHDFSGRTQAKATEAQAKATSDLNEAWTETKDASGRLEIASKADWESAKSSFQSATHKLAVAWHKVDSGKK